jgi:hypothetical protein
MFWEKKCFQAPNANIINLLSDPSLASKQNCKEVLMR